MTALAFARHIRGNWARRNAHGERVSLADVAWQEFATWGVNVTLWDVVWDLMTGPVTQ